MDAVKTPGLPDTWFSTYRSIIYTPASRAVRVLEICEELGFECEQVDIKDTPKGYVSLLTDCAGVSNRQQLRGRFSLWFSTTYLQRWSNLLYHPTMTQVTAYHERTKPPQKIILDVVPLLTDHTPSPAECARIEAEYLEVVEVLTPLEIKGREMVIHGIASKAQRARTLDTIKELTAEAAAKAYALAALTTGDLRTILLDAAWLLERVSYSDGGEDADRRLKAAMWELGAAQLTANVLANEYLTQKTEAAA